MQVDDNSSQVLLNERAREIYGFIAAEHAAAGGSGMYGRAVAYFGWRWFGKDAGADDAHRLFDL